MLFTPLFTQGPSIVVPVSYTHLDVYKRQRPNLLLEGAVPVPIVEVSVLVIALGGFGETIGETDGFLSSGGRAVCDL